MKRYSYQTHGVCAKQISFELEDKRLHNVVFHGGCPGTTSAISRLLEGRDAAEAASLLRGNDCDGRGTSCADQLAIAVEEALQQAGVIASSK